MEFFGYQPGLGWIGMVAIEGPMETNLSHQDLRRDKLPVAVASLAYHSWLVELTGSFSLCMSGRVAIAYMGMARGSPCVVPSWEKRVQPSTKSWAESRYVLISMVAIAGHSLNVMEGRLPIELKALLASTSSTSSVSAEENLSLVA